MNQGVIARSIASKRARYSRAGIAIVVILAGECQLLGQEKDQASKDSRVERTQEMRQIAESFTAFRGTGPERRPIAMRSEPLLRWNDTTRQFSDASLWAWGEKGRPVALVALELYPQSEAGAPISSWAFELISLAREPLEFHAGDGVEPARDDTFHQVVDGSLHWAPRKPGLTFQEIPNAPTPSMKASVRLAQMKDILKRFAASEDPGNETKVVLRLLPRPIYRYDDSKHQLVDGAIFVYATGTNPEAMLLLEAQGSSPEKATWNFAVARITAAAYVVTLDRRDVWSESYPGGQRDSGEAYNTARLARKKPL